MKVISASRRTDIPAFYSRWFVNRLRAGYCHWINPFNAGQVRRVSLRPEDCAAIVFWTRDAAPLLTHLDELDGHRFYFQYTINGYPRDIESHAPPVDSAIDTFSALSRRLSPDLVHWRYDPILLDDRDLSAGYNLDRFAAIARRLAGHTTRCSFSFVQIYGKTRRNLEAVERGRGSRFREAEPAERVALVRRMADIASPLGIDLYSCCGDDLVEAGARRASCIDPETIGRLNAGTPLRLKRSPTRAGCGCAAATDIGAYDTCAFGCAYCYATNSRAAALVRLRAHDPTDTILFRPPSLAGRDLDAVSGSPTDRDPSPGGRSADEG